MKLRGYDSQGDVNHHCIAVNAKVKCILDPQIGNLIQLSAGNNVACVGQLDDIVDAKRVVVKMAEERRVRCRKYRSKRKAKRAAFFRKREIRDEERRQIIWKKLRVTDDDEVDRCLNACDLQRSL